MQDNMVRVVVDKGVELWPITCVEILEERSHEEIYGSVELMPIELYERYRAALKALREVREYFDPPQPPPF